MTTSASCTGSHTGGHPTFPETDGQMADLPVIIRYKGYAARYGRRRRREGIMGGGADGGMTGDTKQTAALPGTAEWVVGAAAPDASRLYKMICGRYRLRPAISAALKGLLRAAASLCFCCLAAETMSSVCRGRSVGPGPRSHEVMPLECEGEGRGGGMGDFFFPP